MPATQPRALHSARSWFAGTLGCLAEARKGFHETLAVRARVDSRTLTALHVARWKSARVG
jgi:hypothetical protein